MFTLKVKPATGEGQSTCRGCKALGKWSLTWTSFLYEVEGLEGLYCRECLMRYAVLTGVKVELEEGRLLNEG